MYEAVISGDGLTLRLQVEGYERRDAVAEDANWLRGAVDLELRGGLGAHFRASCPVAWTTSELAYFNESLRTLMEDLTGTAALQTVEDQVEVRIELASGKGTFSGRVEEPALGFMEFEEVATDQTRLDVAARSLRDIVRRFPPRPY